ncbi:hypothetical protein Vadar_032852 [Vaccinium darrowii]|uniref:Uncharacterized protein n=1 Tax=Vaccinium darrowii TaxID=229202 RepID=A0ACB7YIU6_9ERIC|nr:hypothetical protein Vadar_032852 [Vaccinium darrowii]
MSFYKHSNTSSSSSSSSSDDDGETKAIYRGAAIVVSVYERQRKKRQPHWGGSMKSRQYIRCDRIGADNILKRDYFIEGCTYSDEKFLRRFHMQKSLFMRIHDAVLAHDLV